MSTPIELFTRGDLQTRLVTMNKNERIKARGELCLIIANCKNDEERIQIIEGLKKQFGDSVDVMYFINEVLTAGDFLTEKVVRENAEVFDKSDHDEASISLYLMRPRSVVFVAPPELLEGKVRRDLLSKILEDGTLYFSAWDNINKKMLSEICKLLRENYLGLLTLGFGCPVNDAMVQKIAAALHNNTSLIRLNLGHHRISDIGAKALAAALDHGSSLTSLELRMNSIRAPGAKALAEGLQNNASLTHLSIRSNPIGAEGVKALADILPHSRSLVSLNLFATSDLGSGLDPKNVLDVIIAALQNPLVSLTDLDLGANGIFAAGATAISAILHRTSLISLRLDSNPIEAVGAKAIASALTRPQGALLSSLGLEHCGIGAAGVKDFTATLQSNTSLTKLCLEHNDADAEDLQEVTRICDRNRVQEERLVLNWSRVAILTAFTRANSTTSLRNTVMPLPLVREITNFARNSN